MPAHTCNKPLASLHPCLSTRASPPALSHPACVGAQWRIEGKFSDPKVASNQIHDGKGDGLHITTEAYPEVKTNKISAHAGLGVCLCVCVCACVCVCVSISNFFLSC